MFIIFEFKNDKLINEYNLKDKRKLKRFLRKYGKEKDFIDSGCFNKKHSAFIFLKDGNEFNLNIVKI